MTAGKPWHELTMLLIEAATDSQPDRDPEWYIRQLKENIGQPYPLIYADPPFGDPYADRVLHELGLIERIARAASLSDLHRIIFDPDAAEVTLAIRDALRPASGAKAWFFDGLRAGGLKRIIKMRFEDMKADREAELRRDRASRTLRDDEHGLAFLITSSAISGNDSGMVDPSA
jgi:hypothetical protein